MDFITGSLILMGLITSLTKEAGLPPELILAIIEAESGGNPHAAAFNQNYSGVNLKAQRPALCSPDAENVLQRMAWGLMQVMGATARSAGFDGWLTELVDPEVNIRIGVSYLSALSGKYKASHGLDGVIAAYQAGAPRRAQGDKSKYRNQGYVNKVKSLMPRYAEIAGAYESAQDSGAEIKDEAPTFVPAEDIAESTEGTDSPEEKATNWEIGETEKAGEKSPPEESKPRKGKNSKTQS